MESLFFQESPEVEIATNKFINVPTIIQWEDEPLLQVVKVEQAGYTTRFAVYHSDGTRIAYVKGTQIYPSTDGRKAKIELRSEPNMTACVLEGKTIFELRRAGPGQLKSWAEIYAPEGAFIKATDADVSAKLKDGTGLPVLNGIRNGVFNGHNVAIHITKEGVKFGGKGGKGMQFEFGAYTAMSTGGGGISFLPGDSVHLKPAPGGEAFVDTTNSDGTRTVRGAVAPPSHDAPTSDGKRSE